MTRVAAPTWSLFLQLLEDAGPPWLVAALHGSSAADIVTKTEMKELLTNSDPGGTVSIGGFLALHNREPTFTCWKFGQAGHLARNCPASSGLAPDQPGQAALSALAQEDALVSLIQRQARMQDRLEEAQTRLDVRAAAAVLPSGVAALTTSVPPLSPRAPLIIGRDQPEGYHYVGLNSGMAIWGHSDIVAASVVEPPSDVAQPANHT